MTTLATTNTTTIQKHFDRMVALQNLYCFAKGNIAKQLQALGKAWGLVPTQEGSEVMSVSKALQTYKKLRKVKQISVSKRNRNRPKAKRASKALFSICKVDNTLQILEERSKTFLRSIGGVLTDSPILTLMSMSVEDIAFKVKTEEQNMALRCVMKLASSFLGKNA